MPKRSYSTMNSSQRKAIAISRKERSKWPYGTYGTAHYRRGTPENLERFGQTYKAASPAQRLNRKTYGYVGRGKYGVGKFTRDFKKIVPKSIRQAAETAAVSALASGMSGSGLYGRGLYGRGAYSNTLVEGGRPAMSVGAPNDETQDIVISHSEYLQDVYGAPSANFFVENWQLNPALVENFPWLSQLAQNYEEYEFVQLLFTYKSTVDPSATNNTNGATGTLIMATNYNPTAPNFSTKEVMMQYHGANSGRVTDDHVHGVECDPSKNAGSAQKYTRSQPVVVGQDPKTFDLGNFQLAQVNLPSTFFGQQIGELWVTYTVRLSKPRLFTSLCANSLETRWVASTSGGVSALMGSSTSLLSMQQNGIPIKLDNTVANTLKLTFPDFVTGLFECQLFVEFPASTAVTCSPTLTYTGNVSPWKDLYASNNEGVGDSPGWIVNTAGVAGAANGMFMLIFRVFVNPVTAGIDNTITIVTSCTQTGGSWGQGQLIVRQCNPTLAQSASLVAPAYLNNVGVVSDPVVTP